ncbi:MAG: hypothetical protein Pyrs2KO_14300 [Pyruvatibacter sp.]
MKTDPLLPALQERVAAFMRDEFDARIQAWSLPGPENTIVSEIQCWATPTPNGELRLVIVELLEDGEIEVFPQVMPRRPGATAQVVRNLDTLEDRS